MKFSIIFLLLATVSFAAKYEIVSAGRQPDGKTPITVAFNSGSRPLEADAINAKNWTVTAYTLTGQIPGNVRTVTPKNYGPDSRVSLDTCFPDPSGTCEPRFPPDTSNYLITFSKGGQATSKIQPFNREPPKTGSSPSSGRDDSDVYLFGGLNSAVGSRPTFTIDSFIDWHPLNGFGVNASIKTDNRKKVDPDSFAVKLDYVRLLATPSGNSGGGIHFGGAKFKFDYAGVEFDRDRKNLNFVTSPYVFLSFHAYTTNPATGNVLFTWNLAPKLGLEAGNNFRNSLNENGYGGFVRSLGGARNYFIFRKVLGLERIQLTTDYEVRLPNKAELFSNSTVRVNGQDIRVYRYTRNARHHLTDDLSFMINQYWGLSVKHEYGSLPPVFNMVDHKVSVGLTFKLKEDH